jgi:glycosyltransferase involved in cell wall biosynthesis
MRPERSPRRIQAVGIVLPVHNEELLLPRALDALNQATAQLPAEIECRTAVVLDDCSDDSPVIACQWARDGRIEIIQCRSRNVGAARQIGCNALLRAWSGHDPSAIWLATTDADSQVPPEWVEAQLAAQSSGADIWTGRVEVADWSSHQPSTVARWTIDYGREVTPIHGASMGLTARTYIEAGGFRSLVSGEDRHLYRCALALGARAHHDPVVKVVTSARREARAPLGFAHALMLVESAVKHRGVRKLHMISQQGHRVGVAGDTPDVCIPT